MSLVIPTFSTIHCVKQRPLEIPLWDAPMTNGTGGVFIPNSPDAVMTINRGESADNNKTGFLLTGAKYTDLTNGLAGALAGTSLNNVGAFSVSEPTSFGGNIYCGGINVASAPGTSPVFQYGNFFRIDPSLSWKKPGSQFLGYTVPSGSSDGGGALFSCYYNTGVKLIPGVIFRTVNAWPGAYFAGQGGFGSGVSQSPSLIPGYSFFQPILFSPYSNSLLGMATANIPFVLTLTPPSAPNFIGTGNPPSSLIFDDATLYPTSSIPSSISPYGFIYIPPANTIASAILISNDGTKYWPILFKPMTANARTYAAGSAVTVTMHWDSAGTFWMTSITANAAVVWNRPPGQTVPIYSVPGGTIVNPYQPLRPVTLPCNDWCVNPAISIGRKLL